jgi:hypothetical protein
MSPFKDAIARFINVVLSVEADPRVMQVAASNVCGTIAGTEAKMLDDGLRGLSEAIASAELPGAAVAAICCGAIVENGGNPDIALGNTLDRLQEALIQAQLFAEACENAEGDAEPIEDEEPPELVEKHGEQVAEWMPENALAFQAVEPLGMGAIAMLSRSPTGRKMTRRQFADVRGLADDLAPYHERAHYLAQILSVLDGELLIVLHPEQRKGYRVRIDGVATNFELFVLLAHALIGDPTQGWLAGERPDPVVVAVCRDQPAELAADAAATGSFNFWNWHALRADETLPQPGEASDTWIWMEGTPADIAEFEGQRIVLLGPAPYKRHWHAGRCFEGMPADARVESQLSEAEVQQWLSRLAAGRRSNSRGLV